MTNKSLRAVCIVLFLALSASVQAESTSRVPELPYYNSPEFTPHWLAKTDKSLPSFHRIPAFRLTNQLGEVVTEKTLAGKVYVTNFFFTTCPGICPKMAESMHLVQDAFKNDDEVLLLSHSVTPDTDSVKVLKAYAKLKDCIPHKWHLLTGPRKTIYDLGRKSYFVEEDLGVPKKDDDFLHTENLVLIDKNRHIRGIYNGLNRGSVDQLIADIKTLKKE